MVTVNGNPVDIDGRTIGEYLNSCGYDCRRIAVERNGDIVPKSKYDEILLADGDDIEVVSFVGGG